MIDHVPRARRAHSPRRRVVLLAFAAALSWLGTACDNPACVFGPDGCTGTSSGASTDVPATVPANHQWVELGAPLISAKIPATSAITLGTDSPMAIVFSESMSSASLSGSLRLEETGSSGFSPPVQTASSLVGDGRVLVILPLQALALGTTYDLVWTDNAQPVDLQGQPLAIPTTRLAASFKVAATAPAIVRVLGSFPADLSVQQSGVGEFVVLFDRKVNAVSVTPTSFDVKVGGLDPAFDPLAQPLSISTGGASVSDTRAYRWRSVDAQGDAVPLGAGLQVDVSLSPTGSKITAVDNTILAALHVKYDIAAISPALSAEIVSLPTDAIGLDNITGPKTLDIAVTLDAAVVGDRLGVFIFGNSVGLNPKRIALFRELALTTNATTVHLGETEIDLATDLDVLRLGDGTLSFAIRMQRGAVTTPVRLLDADVSVSGVQSPLLDTVRPVLTGLGTSGTNKIAFSSDLRDLSLVGRANERIRAVEVSTTGLGNNGILTPVVGGTSTGLFVASPVLLGTLTPAQMPLPFTAVIFDNALNRALIPISADFTQFGASGPGAALPGPSVTVQVFDAASLAPVPNARVMVHEDLGGGTVLPIDAQVTGPDGTAILSAAFIGDTFVTVDAATFDLFTFEDVPTDRLSIPLTKTSALPGSVVGVTSSKSSTFATFDRFVVDSRRPAQVEPTITVQSCTSNPVTGSDCAFGPGIIRANQLGVSSLFAIEVPATELAYNALSFLRAFQIAIPVPSIASGGLSQVTLVTNSLLSDAGVDPEERAIDGPVVTLDIGSTNGIVLGALDGDPRLLVEAKVHGLPGAAAVGMGVAFPLAANTWHLRAAYPGAVDGIQDTPQDELGKLVADGVIDPDLRLSVEVRDNLGARAGRRTPFSQIGAAIQPISAPAILSPLPGGATGGATFDVTFSNALTDSDGIPGIYELTLARLPSGRRWTLWRPDLSDASGPTRTIHVPDLAALGGIALADGSISATVQAFAYASFSPASFQWSDIDREFDGFSASAPIVFTQP